MSSISSSSVHMYIKVRILLTWT